MENRNGMYVKGGLALAALGVTYVLAAVVVPKAFVSFTKAAPATKLSVSESRVLGQKILCRADGVDRCIVNVYVLDKNSKGVSNKVVELEGNAEVEALNQTTDQNGRSSYAITSKTEGQVTMKAKVEGIELGQEVKLTFRN